MSQLELAALVRRVGLREESWRDGSWEVESEGGSGLTVHLFDVLPHEFLQEAERDLAAGTAGGDRNAFANAKRSIACMIDQVLLTLGYDCGRWDMRRKMNVIVGMGLTAPRILGRINATRNRMEHSYESVSHAEAEDAVDVAALFVASADPILRLFPGEFVLGPVGGDDRFISPLLFSYRERPERGFHVIEWATPGDGVLLTIADPSFVPAVAVALAADRRVGAQKAVTGLRDSIDVGDPAGESSDAQR